MRTFGKTRANEHEPELPGDAAAVTFAAVLVLLIGCIFAFRGDEARIGERAAEDGRILAQLQAAERTLRARGALERERDGLRARLRRVDLSDDRTTAAARFVREAAAIAARHRTTIASIAAVGPASASATTSETIPLDFTIEGRYADVLATIAALSSARVPALVDLASLARKQAGSPDATLSAQLRVTIERLAPAPASAAPRPA